MTVTATSSTWQSSHTQSRARSSIPSTTPRGFSAVSTGQPISPQRSPQPRTPHAKPLRSPSPNYFGFIVNDESIQPDSNPGPHTKQNWTNNGSSRGSSGVVSPFQSNETNPAYEAFRRQSETYAFNLSKNIAGLGGGKQSKPETRTSSSAQVHGLVAAASSSRAPKPARVGSSDHAEPWSFNLPRHDSPVQASPGEHSVAGHQSSRLSLPTTQIQGQLESLKKMQRSETLPPQDSRMNPSMVPSGEVAKLLDAHAGDVLLLDLRAYPQYATSRVHGALNLCIPTTLLKRPAYTVPKLAETFTSSHDKEKFSKWKTCSYIVVYDTSSQQSKEAAIPFNVLNKFVVSGWQGHGIVIKGGFHSFSSLCPQLIDQGPVTSGQGKSSQVHPQASSPQQLLPVAGGCSMPVSESAANPFFGNIRQNMDLLDGVGQMPVKMPSNMSTREQTALPAWLREASTEADRGKQVSDKFLKIERSEQKRMQKALSAEVSYGAPTQQANKHIQVAGIEKGSKNRYNNIFPFDHTRVKLQNVPRDGCDYVNASFVRAAYSHRTYIATQAPIPATLNDFWRMVWEQDVRVIVMLTAESEGGQVKSHAYWNSGEYGSLKVKKLSERLSSLDPAPKKSAVIRPPPAPRRSTHTAGEQRGVEETPLLVSAEPPQVTVRHLSLSHSAQPFQPMREITQLQYTQWPDFGAPASPTAILGLIDQVNKHVRQQTSGEAQKNARGLATADERPIVVHCSAGCGRTGTFCTVDSVVDMLKRQALVRQTHGESEMDIDYPNDWVSRDDIDLVAKTVDDFRHQRLSMVQNLRQFVLCYESILQWVVGQARQEHQPAVEARGRSFQGSLG